MREQEWCGNAGDKGMACGNRSGVEMLGIREWRAGIGAVWNAGVKGNGVREQEVVWNAGG